MTLEKYNQAMHTRILQAGIQAVESHLNYDGDYYFHLLDSDDREINNQTCKEAFIQTFSNFLRERTSETPNHFITNHEAYDVHQDLVEDVIEHVSTTLEEKGSKYNHAGLMQECMGIVDRHVQSFN